jgi:hypothetical protein
VKTATYSTLSHSRVLVPTGRNALLASFAVLTVCLADVACAITNGQPDGTSHPYVAMISPLANVPVTSPPACCPPPVCSGVAVSPTVIVTTAGCTPTNTAGDQVFVTFDPQGAFATNATIMTGRYYPDPNYCIGCGNGLGSGYITHVLAVVVLDNAISLPRYGQLPSPGFADSLSTGSDVTMVGYGFQARLKKIGPGQFWTRFFTTADLLGVGQAFSDEDIKISANPAQGKGGICFSDGGAPVLLGSSDIVLAIGGFTANSNCVGVSWDQRLDTPDAISFIGQFLQP